MQDFNDPFEGAFTLEKNLTKADLNSWKQIVSLKDDKDVDVESREKLFKSIGINKSNVNHESTILKILELEFRRVIEIVHNSKILSLSSSESEKDPLYENLMWSHYSDGLRGFCLVFSQKKLISDFAEGDNIIVPVKVGYKNKPKKLKISKFMSSTTMLGSTNNDYIQEVVETITTKSNSWSYENELRIISLSMKNLYKYSSSSLLELVIGDKMPEDQKKLVINIAKNENPNVVVKRARLRDDSYLIEIQDYC